MTAPAVPPPPARSVPQSEGLPLSAEAEGKLALFELMGYEPYEPEQVQFHIATTWFRYVGWFSGARGGKSAAVGHDTAHDLIAHQGRQLWNVGPTYDQCQKEYDYTYRALLQDLPEAGFPKSFLTERTYNVRRGDFTIRTQGGSWLMARSCESQESLLGEELDRINGCEGSRIPHVIWTRFLRQRLTTRLGQFVVASTPAGINWLYDEIHRAADTQQEDVHRARRREPWVPPHCTNGHTDLQGRCQHRRRGAVCGLPLAAWKPWGGWRCEHGHLGEVVCATCGALEVPPRTVWSQQTEAWQSPYYPPEERREMLERIAEGDDDAREQGAGEFVQRSGWVLKHCVKGRNIVPARHMQQYGWLHTGTEWLPPESWTIDVGMDWGEATPKTSLFFAIHPLGQVGVFFREWGETHATAAIHARETIAMGMGRLRHIVLDRSAGHLDYHAHHLPTIKSRSEPGTKNAHYALFNRLCQQGRILILEEQAPELCREIPRLKWKDPAPSDDADQRESVRKKDDHYIDGALYIAEFDALELEPRAPEPDEEEVPAYVAAMRASRRAAMQPDDGRKADPDGWMAHLVEDEGWQDDDEWQ